jgi:phage gp45-like
MGDEKLNIDVTVDDGKYRFTQNARGQSVVYRHGERWIEGSFPGINMVIAMACEIEELRAKVASHV